MIRWVLISLFLISATVSASEQQDFQAEVAGSLTLINSEGIPVAIQKDSKFTTDGSYVSMLSHPLAYMAGDANVQVSDGTNTFNFKIAGPNFKSRKQFVADASTTGQSAAIVADVYKLDSRDHIEKNVSIDCTYILMMPQTMVGANNQVTVTLMPMPFSGRQQADVKVTEWNEYQEIEIQSETGSLRLQSPTVAKSSQETVEAVSSCH